MKYCIVEIKTQTATFRNPEFQNFHKTLLLPPPTTLVGLAGAALGLSPKAAQDFFEEDIFEFGVYGKTQGIAKDLWKYDDFKDRSIILKEILMKNSFILIYGCKDEVKITRLCNAFKHPVYALTLGNSDSLAKVSSEIKITDQVVRRKEIEYCILEGDIVSEVLQHASLHPEFSIYTTSEPIALDIPTHFHYQDDYGVRTVVARKTLSFVGRPMTLNIDKRGIIHDDVFIPVFNYQKS
ncbi:MAG: CRISPR-associated protein Cas5 [Bacteroidota bacterium]